MIKNFWTKLKEKNTNDKIVYIFIYASIALFLIFLVQFFLYWFLVTPNNPLNVPLFFQDHGDSFMDFFNVNGFVAKNNPYVDGDSSYPPFVLLIAKFFSLFTHYDEGYLHLTSRNTLGGVVSLLVFFLIVFISLYCLLKKYMKDKNVGKKGTILFTTIFFFSAPMLFLTQRGNYVIFALLFVAVFFVFKDSPKKVLRELSYISLAAAVGIKLYPAIFAIILLKEKKNLAVVKTAIYSVILLTIPFLFFQGGFSNIPLFVRNLLDFSRGDLTDLRTRSNNISIENFIVVNFQAILKFSFSHPPQWMKSITTIFTIIIGGFAIFTAFFSTKRWKIIAACSMAVAILVTPCFMYAAVFLFFPCIAFLSDQSKTKRDWIYMLLFLIIFSPVQCGYIISPNVADLAYGFTVSNYIQALSLLLFTILLTKDAIINLLDRNKSKKERINCYL